MCDCAPVGCVNHPSEGLHTCQRGDPHHSQQDIHQMKVKAKRHHLHFTNTQTVPCSHLPAGEMDVLRILWQRAATVDREDLCFFTCDDFPPTAVILYA